MPGDVIVITIKETCWRMSADAAWGFTATELGWVYDYSRTFRL